MPTGLAGHIAATARRRFSGSPASARRHSRSAPSARRCASIRWRSAGRFSGARRPSSCCSNSDGSREEDGCMDPGLRDTLTRLEHVPSDPRIVWVVLATLRDKRGIVVATRRDLSQLTGVPKARVQTALERLITLGLVEPDGVDQWYVTTKFTRAAPEPQQELPLPGEPRPSITTPEALIVAWNTGAPHLCPVRALTPQRRQKANARLRQYPDVDWSAVIARLDASSFCRGDNSGQWKAGFDFLLRETTVPKTLEGVYDDAPISPVSPANAAATSRWIAARRAHR